MHRDNAISNQTVKRTHQLSNCTLTLLFILFGIFNSTASQPVAFAYPVSDITIDGDLNDWPKESAQYPIDQYPYGYPPKDYTDFNSSFQVAYNMEEQSLYVAVTIVDDDRVIDTTAESGWNTQDSYMFYIDSKHSRRGSGVAFFTFVEDLVNQANVNVSWENNMYDLTWDPELKEMDWGHFTLAKSRVTNRLTYEFKVFLGDKISPHSSIGIDHVIVDQDKDDMENNSFASWGSEGGKSNSPRRLGTVILMNENEGTGVLTGNVAWQDTAFKGNGRLISISSRLEDGPWIITSLDSNLRYEVQLPAGEYGVALTNDIYDIKQQVVNSFSKLNPTLGTVLENESSMAQDLIIKGNAMPKEYEGQGILHDFNNTKAKQLDQFVQAYQEYYQIPGVSLALLSDGKVIYHKTYGHKNVYSKESVDEHTLFEAASITKPVFAYVVCKLAQKNVIDLDKPLWTYLPFEAIAHDERYKLITARHVLSHQTGFPNWAWMNEDGIVDIKFTPGTGYGYSGEGFEYLKRVVAAITKKDIQTVLEEELITPLGLENIYFQHHEDLARVVANGHWNTLPSKSTLPGSPGMAWSMHTEAKAFSDFIFALREGKGLTSEMHRELMTPQNKVPETDDYQQDWPQHVGLGVFLEDTPYGRAFAHGGNNGDFKCLFKMYPDVELGFAVFTNGNHGDELTEALERFLVIGDLHNKAD